MWLITQVPLKALSSNGHRSLAPLSPTEAQKQLRGELLDLCLGISPSVSITHDPFVTIALKNVSRYWNVPALRKCLEQGGAHPLLEKLRALHQKFGVQFAMAPTAPWAQALFERGDRGTDLLKIFDADEAREFFLDQSLFDNADLLADVFRKKEDKRHEFSEIALELDDLGFKHTRKLFEATRDVDRRSAFLARFGPMLKKILKRVDGTDDFDLRFYTPPATLSEKVYILSEAAGARNPTAANPQRLEAAKVLAAKLSLTAAVRAVQLPVAAATVAGTTVAAADASQGPRSGERRGGDRTANAIFNDEHETYLRENEQFEAAFRCDTLPTNTADSAQTFNEDAPPLEFFSSLTKPSEATNRVVREASAESEGVLDHVFDVLNKWESRLAARKSVLRGLIVRLHSGRRRKREEITLSLPRATRSAESLFKIFHEKWMARGNRSSKAYLDLQGFEDEIDSFEVESLAIESDHDRQLDLFEPEREDVEEKWNVLIAQLRSRETRGKPIYIGSYKPFESFLPEQSLKWVEWEEQLCVAPIEDHPKRPLILLRSPRPLNEIRLGDVQLNNENDFFDFCEKHKLLTSLERISDPWNAPGSGERSYVRWKEKWVFWEHRQKKLFLHGYFE